MVPISHNISKTYMILLLSVYKDDEKSDFLSHSLYRNIYPMPSKSLIDRSYKTYQRLISNNLKNWPKKVAIMILVM